MWLNYLSLHIEKYVHQAHEVYNFVQESNNSAISHYSQVVDLIEEIESPYEWNTLVLNSHYTSPTHFFSEADYHLRIITQGEVYLAPFKVVKFYNNKVLLSYGTRVDGGLVPLRSFSHLDECINELVCFLRDKSFDIFNLTFKRYYMKEYVDNVVELISSRSKHRVTIYARILPLMREFSYIWTNKFNKKARNLVKKFKKSNGIVKVLDRPLDYINEIMEVNLSAPIRQGRPMPPSYTNREIVIKSLEASLKEKKGHLKVYGAFIHDKLVAYSYVVEHNGYAYISRFLTHTKYFKYAVSNGLISAIIEDLCNRNIEVVQYGYWSRHHKGVNHFLKQHGFERGKVEAYYIPLSRKGRLALRILRLISGVKETSLGELLRRVSLVRRFYYKAVPRV